MVQPVAQQFEIPKFDIHEDRSITMALSTKKNYDLADTQNMPNDKENEKKMSTPTPSMPQVQSINLFFLCLTKLHFIQSLIHQSNKILNKKP